MSIRNERMNVNGTRREIRNQVIQKFLEEEPGTGKGDDCSKYIYEVERLQNGSRVILKRPAALNKGMDFTVHVENLCFRDSGPNKDMPSHDDIFIDLKLKKANNSDEYEKVKKIISKLYNCENVDDNVYINLHFNVGQPIEAILKVVKWLFIEQDVTYWNWSGRSMLYSGLREDDLC